MLKKMVIVSVLFLSIVSFSKTAGAALTNPLGYYQIADGKVTLNVNFPNILTLNVTIPKMALLKTYLGGYLVFLYWDNGEDFADYGAFGLYFPVDFSSLIPGIPLPFSPDKVTWVGEWRVTGPGKFKVVPVYLGDDDFYHYLETPSDLEDYINDLLSGSGLNIPISVTVTKYSFTGTKDSKDKVKADVSLGITVNIYEGIVKGTITLTASLTTSKGTLNSPIQQGASLSALNGGGSASFKGLANLVVNILKTLPLEDLVPAK